MSKRIGRQLFQDGMTSHTVSYSCCSVIIQNEKCITMVVQFMLFFINMLIDIIILETE